MTDAALQERLQFLKQDMNEQLLGWFGVFSPDGKYADIIRKLDERYLEDSSKDPDLLEHEMFMEFSEKEGILGLEGFFVPEENYYEQVLNLVRPDDVIFDIGAGDMRLDLLLAERVKKVYAVEINPVIIGSALSIIGMNKPKNLIAICGNGFEMDLPSDVTLITNLMIHRKHIFPDAWKDTDKVYCLFGEDNPIVERK